jgi:uncharacterized protein YndB with AHSA1/START domain
MNNATTLLTMGLMTAASQLILGLASPSAQASAAAPPHNGGYKAISMQEDFAHRSPHIHWPAGFEPAKADLFAHNELLINASCKRVWSRIVDVRNWPGWYPNAKDVQISGQDTILQSGTVFRWTTFGLSIESKVHEYEPNRRLGWFGYAPGAEPSFYHSWYLQPKDGMCHVVMDEAGVGKDVAALRHSDETLMHRGHDLWLATLKWIAEAK